MTDVVTGLVPDQPSVCAVDAHAVAVAAKHYVRRLGGTYMKSGLAMRDAARLGLPDFAYYFGGRGSVLGEVDADVVAALFAFFPTDVVRAEWATARACAPVAEIGGHYVETCRAWGRAKLAGLAGAERLAELLELVVRAAEVTGVPLFGGWRAVPLPDDPLGRVAQLAHVLREHRGGHHLTAVLAGGITPLEAILTRENGPDRARFLRWPEPYPVPPAAVRDRRAEIEALTDTLAAPAYAVLDTDQAVEFVSLLRTAYELGVGRGR